MNKLINAITFCSIQILTFFYISNKLETAKMEFMHGNENNFLCKACGKVFYNFALLLHHMKGHNKKNHVKCNHCDKKFFNEKYLQVHVKKDHKKNEKKEQVIASKKPRIHKQENNPSKTIKAYKCNECGKVVRALSNIKRHIKTVHENVREHQCEYCEKAFPLEQTLMHHTLAVHISGSTFQCTKCEKSFSYWNSLRRHMNEFHNGIIDSEIEEEMKSVYENNKSYHCDHCEKKFMTQAQLEKHMNMTHSKEFPCDICDYIAKTIGSLSLHMRKAHQKTTVNYEKFSELYLSCQELENEMKSQQKLKTELVENDEEDKLLVPKIKIEDESTDENILENKKNYEEYDQVSEMAEDNSENAKLNVVKKFNKLKQPKKNKPRKRTDHEKISLNCDLCSKTFSTRMTLQNHFNAQHVDGLPRYKCDHCESRFSYPHSLKRHIITKHDFENSWFCDFCDAGFVHESNLKKHVQKKHSNDECLLLNQEQIKIPKSLKNKTFQWFGSNVTQTSQKDFKLTNSDKATENTAKSRDSLYENANSFQSNVDMLLQNMNSDKTVLDNV